jgi:predicted lysophospholipase L1 biosynthesis ABC-type transport system permease subunit
MMVFVLAVIGCAVFTTYAAGLFFRQKSRETGVFLALGASRRQLQAELGKELALISLCSCTAAAILGGLWPGDLAAVPPLSGGFPGDGPHL